NFTPDKLRAAEQQALFAACDRALQSVAECLTPKYVIGVGAFATDRARAALAGSRLAIGTVLHPSPASPKANRGWADLATAQLCALGIALPSKNPRTSSPA
ncbi:MAG TPA: hypothetical protein VGP93_00495, partial [Polyangiaceae bacterium]|nr:hypothetical protein [Polyangiaceae bacterium]